ncbi:hypothetical protein SAMN06309944_1941 [Micrococcales bacterium KH10]|nr:hypothetical protein SAMN06309944_1941 [Micrococcales bacterium KH10]
MMNAFVHNMTRALRYDFSTLLGPYIAVPSVVGLGVGIAVTRDAPYLGEAMWTVRWFALSLFLIVPVCCAAAAIDASRLSQVHANHLILVSQRRSVISLRAAGITAGFATLAYVLLVGSVLLIGGDLSPRPGWGPIVLALLAQVSVIIWFVAFGSAIGRYLGVFASGAVGAIAGFGLYQLLGGASLLAPKFSIMGDSGASVSQIGLTWNVAHLVIQSAILLSTAVMLMVVRSSNIAGRLVPGVMAVVTFVGVGALLIGANTFVPGEPLVQRPERPDECWALSDDGDTLACYYPEHAKYAEDLLPPLIQLYDAAQQHGYSGFVFDGFEETSRSYEPEPGSGIAPLPTFDYETTFDTSFVEEMLMPTHCPAIYADTAPPERYFRDLEASAMTWLSISGITDPNLPELSADEVLSPDEVSGIMGRWTTCDL